MRAMAQREAENEAFYDEEDPGGGDVVFDHAMNVS